MKKTRIKIKLPQISTREEAAAMVGSIAASVNDQLRLTSEMNERVLAVQNEYAQQLEIITGEIDDKTSAVRGWAEAHRDEFGDLKSITFLQGKIEFRTDPPSIQLLNRKWNWDKVVKALQERLPAFLRDKPEVDKEALLAQRAEPVIAENLALCGMKIAQAESFSVTPNLTEVKTRQVAPAEQKAAA